MGNKSIGWHTRGYVTSMKLAGGSFGGCFDLETVERLSRLFSVRVTESGRLVFVDENFDRVNLYITVDPEWTVKGQEVLKEYNDKLEAKRKKEEEMGKEIKDILDNLTPEEALSRLKGNG